MLWVWSKNTNEPVVFLMSSSVSFWGLGQHFASASVSPSTIYSAMSIRFAATSELESKMRGASDPKRLTLEALACGASPGGGVSILGLGPACTPWGPNAGGSGMQEILAQAGSGRRGQAGSAWAAGLWKQQACPWVSAASSRSFPPFTHSFIYLILL